MIAGQQTANIDPAPKLPRPVHNDSVFQNPAPSHNGVGSSCYHLLKIFPYLCTGILIFRFIPHRTVKNQNVQQA